MGSISSPIQKIRDIDVKKIPTTAISPAQVVRLGSTTVVLGHNGTIYSNILTRRVLVTFPVSEDYKDFVSCLLKLNVISQEEHGCHMGWIRQEDEKRDGEYEIETMNEYAKRHGYRVEKIEE